MFVGGAYVFRYLGTDVLERRVQAISEELSRSREELSVVRAAAAENEARVAGASMRDLSGGETQRVFLARALVTKPALLILDEPTAGVDVGGRAAIVDLMAEISASETMAAVLVTHNLQAIARCAERVVYLERTVRAWGLWSELSNVSDLAAIQVGDHKTMALDGD